MSKLTKVDLNIILEKCDQHKSEYPVLVETGTYQGETTCELVSVFDKIYTIEVHEPLYNKSLSLLNKYSNIHAILGDSIKILPIILSEISENIIFWLDGHNSGSDTGVGEIGCPLLEECSEIDDKFKGKKSLIIIDDHRLFGQNLDINQNWSNINDNTVFMCFKKLNIDTHFYVGDKLILLVSKK